MSGNRVEELEAKVRALEATIDGLTDELIETKERLGAIEDEAGIEPDVLEGRLTRSRRARESDSKRTNDGETSANKSTEDGEEESEEAVDTVGDDIIVA